MFIFLFSVVAKVNKEEAKSYNSSSLVERMKDIVSSTVQYGNTWKDSVQRKTISPITTYN